MWSIVSMTVYIYDLCVEAHQVKIAAYICSGEHVLMVLGST